jgi:hypothetical protein
MIEGYQKIIDDELVQKTHLEIHKAASNLLGNYTLQPIQTRNRPFKLTVYRHKHSKKPSEVSRYDVPFGTLNITTTETDEGLLICVDSYGNVPEGRKSDIRNLVERLKKAA